MFVSKLTVLMSSSSVLFRLLMMSKIVMMSRLMVMMRGGVVVSGRLVVMLPGWVLLCHFRVPLRTNISQMKLVAVELSRSRVWLEASCAKACDIWTFDANYSLLKMLVCTLELTHDEYCSNSCRHGV
jgi:hypothetical protein